MSHYQHVGHSPNNSPQMELLDVEAHPDGDAPATFSPVILAAAPGDVQYLPESSLTEKIVKTVTVLKWVMSMRSVVFSYSGGKDSNTVLSLGLAAALELKTQGLEIQPFAVLNSDTLVENPEVSAVVRRELDKVRRFIGHHQLPGRVEVTTPPLSSQFAVSLIGGKSILSTPKTRRNCTTDLKSAPLARARSRLFGTNDVAAGRFTVGVTGMRFDESRIRGGNMAERGESPVEIVQTTEKDVFISPIARWSTDDVMEHLASIRDGFLPFPSYSDFADVLRVYKDAEGECTVGRGDRPSRACGARHGCWNCGMVDADRSMSAMLAKDEYAYMRPLAQFREFLVRTVFDLRRRTWLGRSIENGRVRFAPDGYSPAMLQELLRYALTIDIQEKEAAACMGIGPRFEIVSVEALIAIDAHWSLQAFAKPFNALKIYRDIYLRGMRFGVPLVPHFTKTPLPEPRYIPVNPPDQREQDLDGLRDPLLEAFGGGGCIGTREIRTKDGVRTVLDVRTDELFSVDAESASLVLAYELDRLLEQHHGPDAVPCSAAEGFRFYVRYGTIAVHPSHIGRIDNILRRTTWRERHGLAGYQCDYDSVLSRVC